MRNESATEPTAIPPMRFSGKRNFRPSRPLMAAPISGRRGTSQMYLYIGLWTWAFAVIFGTLKSKAKDQIPKAISPFQQIDFVNPDCFFVSIQRDDNSQTYRCFCRGHYDHEHSEYLTSKSVCVPGRLQISRHGDEVQIRGI